MRPALAPSILTIAFAAAACGGSTATPGPAAVSLPAATVSPSLPTVAPTGPPATATAFSSSLYPYVVVLPPGELMGAAKPATVAWDGSVRIDSGDAHTDFFSLSDLRSLFVYGAPYAGSVADFATLSQQQVAAWHGCPATPDAAADVTVAGAAGRLHVFTCQGALVYKLMVVRDGFGLVINQIATPPSDEAAFRARFLAIASTLSWR